jgi:single-strand selective monofunctional uracil DNA glycosylase
MDSKLSRKSGNPARALLRAAERLIACIENLNFTAPVAYVYNPLVYAWAAYRSYLERFAATPKRVMLLGMNPGPWGMAQTGVPFGEILAVREWMGIEEQVRRPEEEHPRRPVMGFSVTRSEVSGKRLWGLIKQRFGDAEMFFRDHFVGNYCPLLFLDRDGKNITPDKLRSADRDSLFRCCDDHLRAVIEALQPEWLVGIGRFTEQRLRVLRESACWKEMKVAGILHPSPASPLANRGWADLAADRLISLGIWSSTGAGNCEGAG